MNRSATYVKTFEDLRAVCIRVLGSPKQQPDNGELLELAGCMLRTYAIADDIPERHRAWLKSAATELDATLCRLRSAWESGEVSHLEDALGWKRPAKWDRKAALRHSQYRSQVYAAVENALSQGDKTPEVFENVYESGRFPEWITASMIRTLYYEFKKRQPPPPKAFQRSARKAGKTKRGR